MKINGFLLGGFSFEEAIKKFIFLLLTETRALRFTIKSILKLDWFWTCFKSSSFPSLHLWLTVEVN